MQHLTADFFKAKTDQPHPQRTREILQKHPEIADLMKPYFGTFPILLLVVGLQVGIAAWLGLSGQPWWMALVMAYLVGAFANHALYVIIHEATHNMIFKSEFPNKLAGLLADLPNVFPGSMGFRVYHIQHHAHQGDHDYDADMANYWEAKFIGNSALGKAFWLLLFPVFQISRPARLRGINMWSLWIWFNLACAVAFDVAIIYFCGWIGFAYLLASFFFSIGLHPVGARWIQEHYTLDGNQETFSYYGPLNIVALNVGYHNEHHDFPYIPWVNLPKVKALAPEYYDTLEYHTSWFKLWLAFIFDKRYSLFNRVERREKGKVAFDSEQKKQRQAGGEAPVA